MACCAQALLFLHEECWDTIHERPLQFILHMYEPRSSYAASYSIFWKRSSLKWGGGEVKGEGDYGVRKQRVKSMKWVHNSLGLTSSMWRQVAWCGACLQSTGEEVKGSKLLEHNKQIDQDLDLLRFHSLFWRSVACCAQALCFLTEECWDTIHDTDNCSLYFT